MCGTTGRKQGKKEGTVPDAPVAREQDLLRELARLDVVSVVVVVAVQLSTGLQLGEVQRENVQRQCTELPGVIALVDLRREVGPGVPELPEDVPSPSPSQSGGRWVVPRLWFFWPPMPPSDIIGTLHVDVCV